MVNNAREEAAKGVADVRAHLPSGATQTWDEDTASPGGARHDAHDAKRRKLQEVKTSLVTWEAHKEEFARLTKKKEDGHKLTDEETAWLYEIPRQAKREELKRLQTLLDTWKANQKELARLKKKEEEGGSLTPEEEEWLHETALEATRERMILCDPTNPLKMTMKNLS